MILYVLCLALTPLAIADSQNTAHRQTAKRSGPLWPWAMFGDGQSMRELVHQTDQAAVMDFIVACFDSFIQTD